MKETRLKLALYSIPKAQQRLENERKRATENENYMYEEVEEFVNSIGPYVVQESQYADDRCVSRGALSPDEELFATSGWSGACRIWGIPDCQLRTELLGHTDRVVNIRWHP